MFKWGIIGLGRIAHKFAKELQETAIGKVTAVASRNIDKAALFADEYDIEFRFGSYEDFARLAEVDAVYVAVPHHLHYEVTEMCLLHNKHVLCEKPFTINKNQLIKLVDLARTKNLFLMEAMWTRFMPHIIWLKNLVDSKKLGNILHLKAEFCFKGKERGIQLGLNRLLENELGGGALLDIGIYPLFLAHLLLGSPGEIHAQASIVNDIDEVTLITCNYGHGVSAYLESSILWESEGDAVIYFEHGSVTIPKRWHESNSIHVKDANGETRSEKWEYPSRGFYYEMKEVQECVTSGLKESELMSLDFSLDIMESLDRIRKIINLKYPADLEA
ncbi:MAG: Gfo/Idh/MocA family oxidoreductase [Saprospiraceae bacterium]